LPDSDVRVNLLTEISVTESREKTHARQRKLAFGSVGVLMVFLVVYSLVSIRIAEQRRLEVARERTIATFMSDIFQRPKGNGGDPTAGELLIAAEERLRRQPPADAVTARQLEQILKRCRASLAGGGP
jgi:hypothetical protein